MMPRFHMLLADPNLRAVAIDAPLEGGPESRSPQLLREIVAQFGVTSSPRYRPEGGKTYCNIFAWDVTRALRAEIPHWVGDEGERRELNVNATLDWLLGVEGNRAGWRETDEQTAVAHANAGAPAVVLWRNPVPGKHGHIAVLLPKPAEATEPRIAQAGSRCLFDEPLAEGFGRIHPLRFFVHP